MGSSLQFYKSRILVCEEDPDASQHLEAVVESLGYAAQPVTDGEEILAFLRNPEVRVAALLLGIAPDRGALDILREVRAIDNSLPVIVVAGLWLTRDVVVAMKCGATEFVCKPINPEELTSILKCAFGTVHTPSRPAPREIRSARTFRSCDPRIHEIESRAARIGQSGVPVLIQGETGSGKEVLARNLHAHSPRAANPFLKLNCAALPSELVESELFGYERGAFTGAYDRKAGIFELADGGTILLDEIGDMDIRLQAKLLQVLQDHEFRRIGGKETVKVNVRVMAATHRDLEKAISDRTFREDLYYRLSVIVLQVPPLRERVGDIIPLAEFLIRKYVEPGDPIPLINAELRRTMSAYGWPGNVRELENYMRKFVIFRDADSIAHDLQTRILRRPPASVAPAERRAASLEEQDEVPILEQVTRVNRQAEADAILAALDSTRWNRKHAATILKIDYKSLLYKMKKLGIDDSPASLAERARMPFRKSAGGD